MTEETDRALRIAISSLRSGRVTVRINNESPVEVRIEGDTITVSMQEDNFRHSALKGFRGRLAEFRVMRRLSEVFNSASRRFDLMIGDRKVFSMGKGVRSILGKEKVSFSGILRNLRP